MDKSQSYPDVMFQINSGYINHWRRELESCNCNRSQENTAIALTEALTRLLQLRDNILHARGVFAPVSSFYPNVHLTMEQKQRLYDATSEFFGHYYVTMDKLANLMKRFSDVFPNMPTNSVSKFLKYLRKYALFPDTALPILESGRQYRTFLDHTTSFPSFQWHTMSFVPYQARVVLLGELSGSGAIAKGSTAIEDADSQLSDLLPQLEEDLGYRPAWYFVAPDEEHVCWALCVQLNAIIGRISGHQIDRLGFGRKPLESR